MGTPHTVRPVFVCPACTTSSPHPQDIADGYCVRCHWWTGDALLGPARPELWSANGLQPPAYPSPYGWLGDADVLEDVLGATPHGVFVDEAFPEHPGIRDRLPSPRDGCPETGDEGP